MESFYEMQPDLEAIIKSMIILKGTREGIETLRALVRDGNLKKLIDADSFELDSLIDIYGPGLD